MELENNNFEELEKISLLQLQMEAMKKAMENNCKVKLFGIQTQNKSGGEDIEIQINEFIKDKNVIDIKFNFVRNFLPHTTLGEYQEVWYAMVIYE